MARTTHIWSHFRGDFQNKKFSSFKKHGPGGSSENMVYGLYLVKSFNVN